MPLQRRVGTAGPSCSASWEMGRRVTEGLRPSALDVAVCLATEGAQPSFSLPSYPPFFSFVVFFGRLFDRSTACGISVP